MSITRRAVFSPDLYIPYESRSFPSGIGPANGHATLKTSWRELLWAALTVGRPSAAFVFRPGMSSLFEAFYRISQVRTAVEQHAIEEYLYRTEAFRQLDPTEKGAFSYALGMVLCKLFAHKLLNTHWLLHLDVFKDQLNPDLLVGQSRPDLVGQDRLQTH